MSPRTFVLASQNPHKREELAVLLAPDVVFFEGLSSALFVKETGESYEENALQKACAYYQKWGRPALADDSGLEVPTLPCELGVHSARFGHHEGVKNDLERCELLLKKLKGRTGEDRKALFICVLCFYKSPEEIFFFEGRMEGRLADHISGDSGFGYDPVFIPKYHKGELTLALLPEWKRQNSHRFWACQYAKKFFKKREV